MTDRLRKLFLSGTRPLCYVASPLGFSDTTRDYYRDIYLVRLRTVVDPIDPWGLTDAAEFLHAKDDAERYDVGLRAAERNVEAIRRSSMVVAQLDGQEVDSGTASEVGYASGLGKPCVGIRTDLRQAGEAGMMVNLQVEGLIVLGGGFVVSSLDEACSRLTAFSTGSMS